MHVQCFFLSLLIIVVNTFFSIVDNFVLLLFDHFLLLKLFKPLWRPNASLMRIWFNYRARTDVRRSYTSSGFPFLVFGSWFRSVYRVLGFFLSFFWPSVCRPKMAYQYMSFFLLLLFFRFNCIQSKFHSFRCRPKYSNFSSFCRTNTNFGSISGFRVFFSLWLEFEKLWTKKNKLSLTRAASWTAFLVPVG